MAKSLNKFSVKALTRAGEMRDLEITSTSEETVALELLRAGLTPLSITANTSNWLDLLNRPIKFDAKPNLASLAMFTEQLAEMLKAGLTVERALTVLAKQHNSKTMTELVNRLLRRLSEGSTLSNAMEAEPYLPRYLIGIVRASEQGGRMSEGLADATRYLQRQMLTRRGVINALTYPAVVFVMIMISLTFVLGFVIPEFESIFAGEEHRLPKITRLVLTLSHLVTEQGFQLLLTLIGIPVLLWISIKTNAQLEGIIAKVALRISFIRLITYVDIANVLGVMGALIDNGVEVSESVQFAAQAASTQHVREPLQHVSRSLREGVSVSLALRRTNLIPETTLSIIEVGEHTGSLGTATMRAAQLLETDSMYKIDRLITLLNPIAIALLGLIVGAVISGVMLGIMSINQLAVK
ncbi:MAG: type II secretion system F family protein [Candidatus Cloacimonadaceae bacterium]|jgi:general secretion pathway protein F|nr:type II secretion system F family protein [Candidatus Cloacimonadaceae bacterium]